MKKRSRTEENRTELGNQKNEAEKRRLSTGKEGLGSPERLLIELRRAGFSSGDPAAGSHTEDGEEGLGSPERLLTELQRAGFNGDSTAGNLASE